MRNIVKFFYSDRNDKSSPKVIFATVVALIIIVACIVLLQTTVDFNENNSNDTLIEKINIRPGQLLNLQEYIEVDIANNYSGEFLIDNEPVSKLAITEIQSTKIYRISLSGKGVQHLTSGLHTLKVNLISTTNEKSTRSFTFRTS